MRGCQQLLPVAAGQWFGCFSLAAAAAPRSQIAAAAWATGAVAAAARGSCLQSTLGRAQALARTNVLIQARVFLWSGVWHNKRQVGEQVGGRAVGWAMACK